MRKHLRVAICMLMAFILWTILLCFVDVKPIGPNESSVGFATLNGFVHRLTGVHLSLYVITDWLGLVPFFFVIGFALFGLVQWIRRKHIQNVDFSILVLGGFYIVTMAVYVLFEFVVINHRPVLIDGILEASYPSSTTMLVMCVMPTAMMQFQSRVQSTALRRCICITIVIFTVFMVACRLISGVHWFTDIVGGALFSTGLVSLYRFINK